MRQAPRNGIAHAGLLLAATLLVLSCGPDGTSNLPDDHVWISTHFRYHVRSADRAICADLLGTLEQHLGLLQDMLGLGWPSGRVIDYYKYADSTDFLDNAPCPRGSSGCSLGNKVYSWEVFQQHELVHAYLWPIGRPPAVLVEGAAVALSCSRVLPQTPTLSLADAIEIRDALSDKRVYDTGGRFARYLLDRQTGKSFLQLYGSVREQATIDDLESALRSSYGAGVDQLWTEMLGAQATCPPPFACSRPSLPIDGTPTSITSVCGLDTDFRTFALTARGNAAVEGPVGSEVGSCDALASYPQLATTLTAGTSQVGLLELDAGHYYLSFHAQEASLVSVHAPEQRWAGPQCETLEPYSIAADAYPALSVTLPDEPALWVVRLRFEGPHLMALSHSYSGADKSIEVRVCPDCNFDSSLCQTADLARADLDVLWDGEYFLRFDTSQVAGPIRIDIIGR